MQVVRVSGTIRKAEDEVIKRARAAILKVRSETQDGISGGLNAILGTSTGRGSSKVHESILPPVIGIEDEDHDDDDEEGEVSIDEEG